ncbi:Rv1476 family membrane protein [Williamsia sterculiae]|uniref:Uncharacterized protein n=1 Tax=Williamsia sterculiae TaxID=1344003 RepID=A0A1N7EKS6_9NOCA|nr:DUF6676 family protein [Williamsia sterculiae]SIR88608.1 hypothetical protein SAMN05445060_1409 [Williamsia sterculiae]
MTPGQMSPASTVGYATDVTATPAHLGPFAARPMVADTSGDQPTVDIPAIENDLRDDHVSAPADITPGLVRVVADARDHGHQLNVVVLTEPQPVFTHYRDFATEIRHDTGGTVIVLGPDGVGSSSADFSRVQLEQAQDNLKISDPTVAAQQMVDRVTDQTPVPWTVVTVCLIVVMILGAVIARVRQLRARAAVDNADSDDAEVASASARRGSASNGPDGV